MFDGHNLTFIRMKLRVRPFFKMFGAQPSTFTGHIGISF